MSQQTLAPQNRALLGVPVDRQYLLDKVLSTRDAILEFDPTTGHLKDWAW